MHQATSSQSCWQAIWTGQTNGVVAVSDQLITVTDAPAFVAVFAPPLRVRVTPSIPPDPPVKLNAPPDEDPDPESKIKAPPALDDNNPLFNDTAPPVPRLYDPALKVTAPPVPELDIPAVTTMVFAEMENDYGMMRVLRGQKQPPVTLLSSLYVVHS